MAAPGRFEPVAATYFCSFERLLPAIAAVQISVVENRGWTSALHPIAAVRVVGFRQAARDPKRRFGLLPGMVSNIRVYGSSG